MNRSVFVLCMVVWQASYGQTFQWATQFGGNSVDGGRSVAVDASGNVFATGQFSGTVDFDPGPDTFYITSVGSSDGFISKVDSQGKLIWVKQIRAAVSSIAIDASGNIYITGSFEGTVDLDPGSGTFLLSSGGGQDGYVCKLDDLGNLVWAQPMGIGTNDALGLSVAVDIFGNVISTGWFRGYTDFNPGAGAINLSASSVYWDIYISKLSPSGNFMWAKQFGGWQYDHVFSVTVDDSGNVYSTGYFRYDADFDPGPGTFTLTSDGSWDIFIIKLDASGSLIWVRQIGGDDDDVGQSITVDSYGNTYVAGWFKDTVDFDPGPATFNLRPIPTGFIVKLNSLGNFVWAKQTAERVYSVAVDDLGNVYSTGVFGIYNHGIADFDPGTGTYNLTTAGEYDVFIEKLDAFGNFMWAKKVGAALNDFGYEMAVDMYRNAYIIGTFRETVDFDPGNGTFNLSSAGGDDAFLLKLNDENTITISGTILTETGTPIPGATVTLTGDDYETAVTDTSGHYRFPVVKDGNYIITPFKTNDVVINNGITSVDILLTRRHLLGTPLNSPYKIIAADVDSSNSVSTLDILLMRSMILQVTTTFPNGRLWSFVPSDHIFTDPLNPFPFPSPRTYTNITTNQTNQNFIGIKLGDVNGSWGRENSLEFGV